LVYQSVAEASAVPSPSAVAATDEVLVPNLAVFNNVSEMKVALAHNGLVGGFSAKGSPPSKEQEFKVASQSPAPNTKVKRGAEVAVSIYQKFEQSTEAAPAETREIASVHTPSPSPPAVNWSGTYTRQLSDGGSVVINLSGNGDSLSGTEHWTTGKIHGTNTWTNCKVSGTTAKCDWTGTYEGDPDKSGTRKGTLEVTLSGDTIAGTYYEDEPSFSWKVTPYPSAMRKGAVWPLQGKRQQ
jgi:hypothetical protein